MTRPIRTAATPLLLALTVELVATAARAEPLPPAGTTTLDPTVVTAPALHPQARGTLTKDDLEQFQSRSVADLTGLVPGLHVVTSDTRGFGDLLSIRGSTNTLFFSAPAVGMVIDDVPQGDTFAYPATLLELARLQVLRGPQGAGFGRNAPAGMITMATPPPAPQLDGSIIAEYGSYDSWGTRLQSSGPLGTGFAHTLQLYHLERDGLMHNRTLGRATDDRALTGGLANLHWRPAEDTELRLRVLAERADDGSQRLSRLDSRDPFTVASEIPGETDLDRHQVSFHLTKDTPHGCLKSITAWQRWDLDPSVTDLDLLNSPAGFASSSTIIQQQEMFTQEFRWEAPADAGPWSWQTGLFLLDKSTDGDATRRFPAFVPMAGTYIPYAERTLFTLDQRSAAVYGRANFAASDRLELTAGARLEYVADEIVRSKTDSFAATGIVRDDTTDWLFSPELGATWAVGADARLFARSAIGIKPAGFSAFADTQATARFAEESNWANELGLLIALPDPRLKFTLTGFWNRIDDYQLDRPATGSTGYLVVNAGRVTALGAEATLDWRPTDGFSLLASLGCTEAEFDDHADPLATGRRYDGNSVPYIPEFTGSLGARYDFSNGFYLQTSIRLAGATWFDEANDPRYRQGSWWLWNAEAGYANDDFSVAVYGTNLLDEEYYSFINPQINAGSPGDPQCFGIRARVAF